MSATSDLPVSDSAVQIDAGKGAPSSPPRDGNSVPQPRNSKPPRLHLAPLDGARGLASLWVVMEHYASSRMVDGRKVYSGGDARWFLAHGNAAVSYFLVLSGFVTSYAYGQRDFNPEARFLFWRKRFTRVALSYYAALALGIALLRLSIRIHNLSIPFHWRRLLPEVLMAQSTVASFGNYNSVSWTISTLACCWLLYPAMQPRLRHASLAQLSAVVVGCVVSNAGMWLLLAGSVVGGSEPLEWIPAWLPGSGVTDAGYPCLEKLFHVSPVVRLPDFVLGAACAQLLRHGIAAEWFPWRWVASGSILAAVAIAAHGWGDVECGRAAGWPPAGPASVYDVCAGRLAFSSCLSPLFAAFMLGSAAHCQQSRQRATGATVCAGGGGGGVGGDVRAGGGPLLAFFSSRAMASVGALSLQVYVFQEPTHNLWLMLEGPNLQVGNPQFGPYLVFFLLSLWILAAAFATYVEGPFMRAMASKWKRAPPAEWTVRAGNRLLGTVAAVYWSLSVGVLVAGCSLAYAALSYRLYM